jgi:hypothetical protein
MPLVIETQDGTREIGTVEITVHVSQIVLDDQGRAVAVLGRQ